MVPVSGYTFLLLAAVDHFSGFSLFVFSKNRLSFKINSSLISLGKKNNNYAKCQKGCDHSTINTHGCYARQVLYKQSLRLG